MNFLEGTLRDYKQLVFLLRTFFNFFSPSKNLCTFLCSPISKMGASLLVLPLSTILSKSFLSGNIIQLFLVAFVLTALPCWRKTCLNRKQEAGSRNITSSDEEHKEHCRQPSTHPTHLQRLSIVEHSLYGLKMASKFFNFIFDTSQSLASPVVSPLQLQKKSAAGRERK